MATIQTTEDDFLNDPDAMKKLALIFNIDLESTYRGNPKPMNENDYNKAVLELAKQKVIT